MIYLPPAADVQFGDLYNSMPSVHVEARPLKVGRHFRMQGGREVWGVHSEAGEPPAGGFRWSVDRGPEDVIAKAFLGRAIVLSHDCEIENDHRHRLLAMVRPLTDIQREHQASILRFENWAAFPLPDDEERGFPVSFVDFRRLTTVRPGVLLPDQRQASISDEARKALAERFWGYLMRPLQQGG